MNPVLGTFAVTVRGCFPLETGCRSYPPLNKIEALSNLRDSGNFASLIKKKVSKSPSSDLI